MGTKKFICTLLAQIAISVVTLWLILSVSDAVVLQIAGNCAGNGSHIFTVAGANLTGNSLNWTITN